MFHSRCTSSGCRLRAKGHARDTALCNQVLGSICKPDYNLGFYALSVQWSSHVSNPLRLAVLISGTGKTLKNLIDRIGNGSLHAEICIVIASRPDAPGLQFARDAGIRTQVVSLVTRRLLRRSESGKLRKDASHVEFDDVASFSRAIFKHCRTARAQLVVLGGFLKLLRVPKDFQNKVINIHPSLLPSFGGKGYYGIHVHEEVLKYGAKVTGCTVHFVDNEYDHGPVILQAPVSVLEGDTPERLADRVFQQECELYPQAIQLLCTRTVKVVGKTVVLQQNVKKARPPHTPRSELITGQRACSYACVD